MLLIFKMLLCLHVSKLSLNKYFVLVCFESIDRFLQSVEHLADRLQIDTVGSLYGYPSAYFLFAANNLSSLEPLLQGQLNGVRWAKLQMPKIRVKRGVQFNDEQWPNMWYLNENVYPDTARMNVFEAWSLGYTGKGISVTIIDDGLERTHIDLKDNYNALASYDFNDMDSDPSPRPTIDNQHGTRCAGVVAAKANNSFCSVGIAFNSRIGGIRLLDGIVTDAHESMALNFGVNDSRIDIYSASWGPSDNGATADGPNIAAMKALKSGVLYGRKGKGSIYVWATGNGGRAHDHCSCDGYVSSPYTIAVGSMTERGQFPLYAERCASIMTTTYSSGNDILDERSIITTDLGSECTTHHTGTSVSAPMFAGIIALALEANANLCWRQVQYLTILSSRPLPNMLNRFTDDKTWWRNGAGLLVSDSFGYGMVDAGLLVKLAAAWKAWRLPERKTCFVRPNTQFTSFNNNDEQIKPRTKVLFKLCTDGCSKTKATITSLEHVSLVLTVKPSHLRPATRGSLEIHIKSPSGVQTPLLLPRKNDLDKKKGFVLWPFTSVLHWLEDPRGCWQIILINHATNGSFSLSFLEIILNGVDFTQD